MATVQLAVELGADANAVDEDGSSALHHVVDKGFDRVVAFLAESGANVNARNKRGQTPLAMVVGRRRGRELTESAQATAALLRDLGAEAKRPVLREDGSRNKAS